MAGNPSRPLHDARILIVGVGGLGLPAAYLLAANGAGELTLIDPDTVSISNLHRQLLFEEDDIGQFKAIVTKKKLAARFPQTRICALAAALDDSNAVELIAAHDWVIDATDAWQTKLWLHDRALLCGRPIAHAGAVAWRGQALTALPGEAGCLRCVANTSAVTVEASCQQAGIVPGVVQLLGTRLALEAVCWFRGRKDGLLLRKLLYVDAYRARVRIVPFEPDPHCTICGAASTAQAPRTSP